MPSARELPVGDDRRQRAPLLQGVEAHCTAGHDLVLRLGGQWPEPVAEHLRRAGEEAVLMRIIGRPHDLVRADIVGQHGDAVLDRLERDPAIALEELARPHLRGGFVEPVSSKCRSMRSSQGAIQPPPDFEKRDAQPRVTIDDPPQITAIAASIISIVWQIMWRAARSRSKRSTPTVGIAVVEPS